jgi:uncharacterized protein YjeT (DUF2065 family)
MTTSHTPRFLRRALTADAVITGTTALVLVAAATMLEDLLGLPASLLRGAGLSLIPFTVLLVYLLRRDPLPRGAAWFVVICNALWAIDSIVLLLTDWVDPTLTGQAFVVFQAVVVAAFAEAQYIALRRLPATAA